MLKYILISFLIVANVYAYTCEEMGYTKSIADCPDGGLKCPAEPEKMFCCDPCGNTGAFKYNESNCSPNAGLQLAGTKCGGRWTECRSCTSEYKYNKDNCRSPKILAGVQCGNAYTGCVYPTNFGCVPTVGYIYYADGTCHSEYDSSKDAIGVIIDAAGKLLISLGEYKTTWGDAKTVIPDLKDYRIKEDALLDMDGNSNTDIIVGFAKEKGMEYPAAQYCANMTAGNKKWFLPALGQLTIVHNNLSKIQAALSIIPNVNKISTSDVYHSSTEAYYQNAWYMKLDTAVANQGATKSSHLYTRCMAYF